MKRKCIKYIIITVSIIICAFCAKKVYDSKSYTVFDQNMEMLKKDTMPGEARMVYNEKENNDYFLNVGSEREEARAKAYAELKKIVENPDISSETKQECEKTMIKMSENIAKERDAELMIKSKGFTDVVVFINDDSVTVTVKTDTLTSSQVTQIKDVINEFVSTKNIKIVEVK